MNLSKAALGKAAMTALFASAMVGCVINTIPEGPAIASATQPGTLPSRISPNRDNTPYLPVVGANEEVVAKASLEELRQLQLIASNLVSALVQIPELQPAVVTLQVSRAQTIFGNTLIRALENAGFGLQLVSADQGKNYVSYGKRFSETDSGPITDYDIGIGKLSVRREYITTDSGIFPSSLMAVSGTQQVTDIVLNDAIFREQGGVGDTFISGVQSEDDISIRPVISEVDVNAYDATPESKRTSQTSIFDEAKKRFFETESQRAPVDFSAYQRSRRTVLIFGNNKTMMMGPGNKQAVRLMVREYLPGDIFVVTACTDVDGENENARVRGIRVEQEFASHGVPVDAVALAECIRASYRHESDNSEVPVEVVHYRIK